MFLRRLAEYDARTPAWIARLAAEQERAALEQALAYAEQRRAVLRAVEAWEARIAAAEGAGFAG